MHLCKYICAKECYERHFLKLNVIFISYLCIKYWLWCYFIMRSYGRIILVLKLKDSYGVAYKMGLINFGTEKYVELASSYVRGLKCVLKHVLLISEFFGFNRARMLKHCHVRVLRFKFLCYSELSLIYIMYGWEVFRGTFINNFQLFITLTRIHAYTCRFLFKFTWN